MAVLLEHEVPGKACQGDGRYLCAGTGLEGEVGCVADNERGCCHVHGSDLVGQACVPGVVEVLVRLPGRIDVDRERAVLDTADILLNWLMVPGNRQAVAEK